MMKHALIAILWFIAAPLVLQAQTASAAKVVAPEVQSVLKRIESNMVPVRGGSYMMGATEEQARYAYDWEKPVHKVIVADFKISRYEVTQEEWEAIMGVNPSMFKGRRLPVENVSWNDCQQFIKKLNQLTGKKYRLPTEAEWEYAARGGAKTTGMRFAGSDTVKKVAWFYDNSDKKTHEVGLLDPNELGLYDMSGNVGEWCEDFCDIVYGYASVSARLTQRVRRGGNWNTIASFCRNSYRYGRKPDFSNETLGFRLAL